MSFSNLSAVEHAANQEYVHRVNTAKGWFATPVTFLDAMALLLTEVVEVDDAFDEEGFGLCSDPGSHVSSEFADIYIRLLDDCSRWGVDLGLVVDAHRHSYEFVTARGLCFSSRCMALARRIRDIVECYRIQGLSQSGHVADDDTHRAFAHLYLQLQDTCGWYGVDLREAFRLKMKINEDRPYRHGNKFA